LLLFLMTFWTPLGREHTHHPASPSSTGTQPAESVPEAGPESGAARQLHTQVWICSSGQTGQAGLTSFPP
jgi:hypothetical protein